MGTIYQVACSKCGYKKEFHLGSGLGSINLHRNLRFFAADEQQKIDAMEKQGMIDFFQIENKFVFCQQCRKMDEKTIINIESKDCKSYIFGNFCNTCGKELVIFGKGDFEKVMCPICGEKLSFKEIGRWD